MSAPEMAFCSAGNALRPPRNIALIMAKTATKQPIGPPELDAHISMYEPAKWPLTKRDQTYLSQANKFWNFISTDAFLVGLLASAASVSIAYSILCQIVVLHCTLVNQLLICLLVCDAHTQVTGKILFAFLFVCHVSELLLSAHHSDALLLLLHAATTRYHSMFMQTKFFRTAPSILLVLHRQSLKGVSCWT